jgi:hypothetical protein
MEGLSGSRLYQNQPRSVNVMTNLTAKEQKLYDAIAQGMDEPGCGWLHELAPETRSTSGVLGNLIKKGLVVSAVEDGCSWVQLTELGNLWSAGTL